MLSTLIGLVQDGKIAEVTPGFGAICFASVVIVTMFAASCFDPRLMWDAAARRSADAPARSRASQASHA
jgi:paraquat-inducible protein A